MTFKDLQRLIGSQSDVNRSTISPQEKLLLASLETNRFGYGTLLFIRIRIEYVEATAAFNHIIGLPRKEGVLKSFFDYEKMLYILLSNNKNILPRL